MNPLDQSVDQMLQETNHDLIPMQEPSLENAPTDPTKSTNPSVQTTLLYRLNNHFTMRMWEISLSGLDVITRWGPNLQVSRRDTYLTHEAANQAYDSAIHHKIHRKGYSLTIPRMKPPLPMLAQDFDWKRVKSAGFSLQYKLKGQRCIATNKGLRSRANTEITVCPHIELLAAQLPEGVVLDGELYMHGVPEAIISGLCRRIVPNPQTLRLEYHVYDVFDEERTFCDRFNIAQNAVQQLSIHFSDLHQKKARLDPLDPPNPYLSKAFPIKVVPTHYFEGHPTNHKDDMDNLFALSQKEGYEGIMFRDHTTPYESDVRSYSLMKVKPFNDAEFKIIGIEPDRNGCAVFECVMSNGNTFKTTLNWERWRTQHIASHPQKYIGKHLKVEYQGLTHKGIPSCPKATDFRDGEVKF